MAVAQLHRVRNTQGAARIYRMFTDLTQRFAFARQVALLLKVF